MPYNLIYLPQKKRSEFIVTPIFFDESGVNSFSNMSKDTSVLLHFHDLYAALLYVRNKRHENSYIITIHNDFWYLKYRNKIKVLLLLLDKRCKKIVFCSKPAARGLNNIFKKITFIDNGYPFTNEILSSQCQSRRKNILIFCKSNDNQKNNKNLFQKMRDYRNYHVDLLGSCSNEIKRKLECCSFQFTEHGMLNRLEVEDLQRKSVLVISNSKYEGLPIAILECVNFGVIPLLSNIPAHRYMVPKHLHEYFIYKMNSKKDLEIKLNNIHQRKDILLAFCELQNYFSTKFHQVKMLDAYDSVYRSVLGSDEYYLN